MVDIGNRYKMIKRIGRGGFSDIFLVQDVRIGKNFVAKRMTDNEVAYKELEWMKQLSHSGLPRLHDVLKEQNEWFIIMQYMDGINLREYITCNGRLKEYEVVRIAHELLEILAYLHTCNKPIIYGDLKPDNLMIRKDGSVALIDFGSALNAYEKKGDVYTTKGFAAPEQLRGEYYTQSDIYAFGKLLQYMLTGCDPVYMMNLSTEKILQNYGVKGRMVPVIIRCCQENPERRYVDAAALLREEKTLKKELHLRQTELRFSFIYVCVGVINCVVGIMMIYRDEFERINVFFLGGVILFAVAALVYIQEKELASCILSCEYSVCISDYDEYF